MAAKQAANTLAMTHAYTRTHVCACVRVWRGGEWRSTSHRRGSATVRSSIQHAHRGHDDGLHRPSILACCHERDALHNTHTTIHAPEHGVLAVQVRRGRKCDEKLQAQVAWRASSQCAPPPPPPATHSCVHARIPVTCWCWGRRSPWTRYPRPCASAPAISHPQRHRRTQSRLHAPCRLGRRPE